MLGSHLSLFFSGLKQRQVPGPSSLPEHPPRIWRAKYPFFSGGKIVLLGPRKSEVHHFCGQVVFPKMGCSSTANEGSCILWSTRKPVNQVVQSGGFFLSSSDPRQFSGLFGVGPELSSPQAVVPGSRGNKLGCEVRNIPIISQISLIFSGVFSKRFSKKQIGHMILNPFGV